LKLGHKASVLERKSELAKTARDHHRLGLAIVFYLRELKLKLKLRVIDVNHEGSIPWRLRESRCRIEHCCQRARHHYRLDINNYGELEHHASRGDEL